MGAKPELLVIGPRGLWGYEGGVEKFSDKFLTIAAATFNISIFCLEILDDKPVLGVNPIKVPKLQFMSTDKALYILYSLFFYAFRKYDHVLILGTNFSLLIPIFRAMFWRKAKIHIRSGSVDQKFSKWSPIIRCFMRRTELFCTHANTVIANSPSIQRHLKEVGIDSVLVRNGLDKRVGDCSVKDRCRNQVLAVGRITSAKNYSLLLEASNLLDANIIIQIIGGPDASDEYNKLMKIASSQSGKVNFLGRRRRDFVLEKLNKSTLFVNCSTYEGMSNSVLEAIQSNIPIILSDIAANRDLALDEHFYFSPKSSQELANKILDALKEPAKYIVDKSRFEDWDDVSERLVNIIQLA